MMRVGSLATIGLLLISAASRAETPAARSVQVETAPPRQQVLKSTVDGYGVVTTSDDAVVGISFLHAGQIILLRVRSGEVVKAGQALLELAIDPAATLSYQAALAALNFAERDLARTKTLLAQHLATNAQLTVAQKAVEDAAVALDAQRKLGNDRRTEVVTAPFDSYVAALVVGLGDRVQPNTTVLKLARTDRVQVTVSLEPEDAARVRAGMSAQVVPVYAPDLRLDAVVRGVAGAINTATKRVDAWVEVSHPPPRSSRARLGRSKSCWSSTPAGWCRATRCCATPKATTSSRWPETRRSASPSRPGSSRMRTPRSLAASTPAVRS